MYATEQPQIDDRGSNPVAINQFLTFFSLLTPHVLILFLHLLIFFTLCDLLYLIKLYYEILCLCSTIFTENRNNLRMKEFSSKTQISEKRKKYNMI